MNKKVLLFPGQGSQVKGMGSELFDDFSDYEAIADSVLGYSIRDLCLNDPNQELHQTQFTQPALFVVNALSYLQQLKTNAAEADFFAGHSLGEFNALFAAGVFDFETGLRLVKKRGELMSGVENGGMAAVIGCDAHEVERLLKQGKHDTIDVANYNSPVQTVLSGPKVDLTTAELTFEKSKITYIQLNVSAAFHSRYMECVQKEFKTFIESFALSEPRKPVISNVTGLPYLQHSIVENLSQQIVSSVRWTDSMVYLISQGVSEFAEIGPGDVLTKLYKVIKKDETRLLKIFYKSETERRSSSAESSARKQSHHESPPSSDIRGSAREISSADASGKWNIKPEDLGCSDFKKDYNLRYAYVSGAMYKGIASKELVVKMGMAGYLSFLGTGGLKLSDVEENLRFINSKLTKNQPFGANLLNSVSDPDQEMHLAKMFLEHGVRCVEASAYTVVTPALVYYKLTSLKRDEHGVVRSANRIIAKISRPEVASAFMMPAPDRIVKKLLQQGLITQCQAEMGEGVAVADDLTVEADSGGHTDMGNMTVLLPSIIRLRDEISKKQGYESTIRVGAAGGIGTPESAGAAFLMGADFIVTGSINQCTVEAGTSEKVKDILQNIDVQDTDYAPAGDMFELGAKIQVVKKGVFFPARANKLYDLWRQYKSLDDLDEPTKVQLEEKYFKNSFEDIWQQTKNYYMKTTPSEIDRAEKNPKHKMALTFRWYFIHSNRLAMQGDETSQVDYQIHCGPALGAFNQWVKGTDLALWQNRHVDEIAEKLMIETASYLTQQVNNFAPN